MNFDEGSRAAHGLGGGCGCTQKPNETGTRAKSSPLMMLVSWVKSISTMSRLLSAPTFYVDQLRGLEHALRRISMPGAEQDHVRGTLRSTRIFAAALPGMYATVL